MVDKVELKGFFRLRPWWLKVTLIYGAARLVSFGFLLSLAKRQGSNPWGNPSPAYGDFINFWDSGWYYTIYREGYPAALPVDETGSITENQWAFHPLYPFTVRVLSWVFGMNGTTVAWNIFAPSVSWVAGLATSLAFFKLFRVFTESATALWAVAFFAFSPVSPILQLPYAESLSLAFLTLALLYVAEKKYMLALPMIALMCLSRPIGVAFGMMLGIVFCLKAAATWRYGWRRGPGGGQKVEYLGALEPFSPKASLKFLGVSAFTLLAALLWPIIAWWSTGRLSAYVDTETVWRGGGLVPVRAWLDMTEKYFGVAGVFIFILAVFLFIWWIFSPSMRRLGIVLEMWALCYVVYLVLFLNPQSSTWRILLLPLISVYLWLAMLSRDKYYRAAVLVAAVCWQYLWCASFWFYDISTITPP